MKDNFSAQANLYARHRPTYPPELFEFLLSHCKHYDTAWDVATGNGQAAVELAKHFKKVYATDISSQQIENATPLDNITYNVEQAEVTSFKDNTFNLITVAQALHWFDHDKFFNEVIRVAKPNALFAAWGYSLIRVDPAINIVIDFFYKSILKNSWDEERTHVDDEYSRINMPYPLIQTPNLQIQLKWDIEDMIGYLHSWSAVQRHIKKHKINPVIKFIEDKLRRLWLNHKIVRFPIFIKAFIIKK